MQRAFRHVGRNTGGAAVESSGDIRVIGIFSRGLIQSREIGWPHGEQFRAFGLRAGSDLRVGTGGDLLKLSHQ
jgi:hypothetical protein